MTRRKASDAKPFSAVKSAADALAERQGRKGLEDADAVLDRSVISGQMVQTPKAELAYKVVLDHADGSQSEHVFQTMREGEAFIKRRMPRSQPRDRSRDRAAGTA
jgi:hypothetical protein